MATELTKKRCESCEGIGSPLQHEQIMNLMPQLNEKWLITPDEKSITRSFSLANFYETMALINAIAFMAHTENHHPDMQVGYNHCSITYSTHALNGLSLNDFICAAKVDALIAE